MLADLDDPPPSRVRGILIGIGVGSAVALALGLWFLPSLHAQLMGSAEGFDARLRQEDAYMQGLCNEAISLERDEALCACALAAEYPSLDCRIPFMDWTLQRQHEQCADASTQRTALSFCACVDALHDELLAAEDSAARRQVAQRYGRCTPLPDALYLPSLDRLAAQAGDAQ